MIYSDQIMGRTYYSLRNGSNPNISGLPLRDVIDLGAEAD